MQVSLRAWEILHSDTNINTKVPYGFIIAISILICVFLNDRFVNRRCLFIVIFLLPNIAGSFGLAFLPADSQAGRLICYYLTGPYNAAFVMVLSMQTANTAGLYFLFTFLITISFYEIYLISVALCRPHQESSYERCSLPWLLLRQYRGTILL